MSTTAGGDLTGTLPNPGVGKVAGIAVTPVTPGTLGVVCSTVLLTGQSASITSTNILCNGGQAPAGLYRIAAVVSVTVGQTGTGNVGFTLNFTTAGIAQGAVNGLIGNTGLASQGTTSPSGTSNGQNGMKMFWHDGTTHITFSTTYAATGQYDVHIALERLL